MRPLSPGWTLDQIPPRDGDPVIQKMEEDAREDAPAPHGQQSQDDPQQRRVEQLLKQAEQDVEETEHQRGEEDRRARPMLVFQPRENEAAEREFLANRRDQREDNDGDLQAGA